MDGASPELGDITLDVEIDSPDSDDKTARVFGAWQERCPIYLGILRPNAVALSMRATRTAPRYRS